MASNNLYNLIMHNDPDFWKENQKYVDFPKERFLEYTIEDIKNQFQSLDQRAIKEIKELPTLFAVEHEESGTKIGKITKIDIQSNKLRVYFIFDDKNPLSKGALKSPELDIDKLELYRTHWAIKEGNLNDFLEKRSETIEGILDHIKKDLDATSKKTTKKVSTLYACNGSGKTRLSKLFADQYHDKVLCYNAFTEDLFSWDNDNDDYVLNIDANALIFKIIQDQGLDREIIDNFQKFTGSKLEPTFNIPKGQITFGLHSGDENNFENIKISRGEESIFVWSIFYTILNVVIEALNELPEDRSTADFDDIQYIIIDDPVSSMDDTRIITIALELNELIKTSSNQLKFLITTHHALFFNVLFNVRNEKGYQKEYYIMSQSNAKIYLKRQKNGSPFAYHHAVISEIKNAINSDDLKKYHFNLFRALLEKTANFLGYSGGWKKLLSEGNYGKAFIKTLNHYSHNSLSDLEPKDLSESNKEEFKEVFQSFIEEFKWGMINND